MRKKEVKGLEKSVNKILGNLQEEKDSEDEEI